MVDTRFLRALHVAVLVFAALSPGLGAAQALPKVAIASLVISSSYLPLWIAEDQRFFEKHGVEAEVRILPEAYRHIGRSTQFGVVGVPAVLAASADGQDVRMLMPIDEPRVTALLLARPGIVSPADLRGKRFGVTSIGTGAWINENLALDHFGIDPAQAGIRFVVLGGGSAALGEALEAGTVDVVSIDAGQAASLQAKGYPVVLDFATSGISGVQSTLAVDAAYQREHPDVVERVATAMLEGLAFGLAPGNERAVKEILGRRMNLATNPAALEAGYRSFLLRANRRPIPSVAATQRLQNVMSRADPVYARVQVPAMLDDRVVRKLDEAGVIDRLFTQYGVR